MALSSSLLVSTKVFRGGARCSSPFFARNIPVIQRAIVTPQERVSNHRNAVSSWTLSLKAAEGRKGLSRRLLLPPPKALANNQSHPFSSRPMIVRNGRDQPTATIKRNLSTRQRRKGRKRGNKPKRRELLELGIPNGKPLRVAQGLAKLLATSDEGRTKEEILRRIEAVLRNPGKHALHDDDGSSELAFAILSSTDNSKKNSTRQVTADADKRERDSTNDSLVFQRQRQHRHRHRHQHQEVNDRVPYHERTTPAPWKGWGLRHIEESATEQMTNAMRLPVSVRGALMPDAHAGYGLPIGGVLATSNSVIPYAVGVDIGCRMKLSILDVEIGSDGAGDEDSFLRRSSRMRGDLCRILREETKFGVGAAFDKKRTRDHPIMYHDDWNATAILANLKDKARHQLGTSGSGNHFVSFGIVSATDSDGKGNNNGGCDGATSWGSDGGGDDEDVRGGAKKRHHLALLSHSGSRGPGSAIANHYSRLASSLHPTLPRELRHLAWLDMDKSEGQEYFASMNLMGQYASANHDVIHDSIVKSLKFLGCGVTKVIENHHNYCWREVHDGQELYVHRKGATPAGRGVLGIIPGSMSTPAYIVEGRGNVDSLQSASHGAGRLMSRRRGKDTFTWARVMQELSEKNVTLLSGGLDEAPGNYRNIQTVIDAQRDLVNVIGMFEPRIVKMAPAGERPED